jgi:tripartite-type tricarboxylate transporter receptor subunit TctC
MRRSAATVYASAFIGLLAILPAATYADEPYPSKPIRFSLPQPAGGAVDLLARSIGERLSEQLKQPVIVENMPGANGSLAAGAVARAAPDGHTLLFAVDSNLVINPHLYNNLAYDSFRDFVPISIVAKVHMTLVANPKVEANNISELIALAKANPGKLNYASIGFGTSSHMGMELLKMMTKVDITLVSYRGTSAAMTDVVAGVVDVMFTGPPSAIAMSAAGKLKLLAVSSLQRHVLMPNVPTLNEAGVPGYQIASWFGVLTPAKTPNSIVDRLSQEISKAVNDPRFSERMKAQGMEIVGSTSAEMLTIMEAETKQWAGVIKATGTKIPQ